MSVQGAIKLTLIVALTAGVGLSACGKSAPKKAAKKPPAKKKVVQAPKVEDKMQSETEMPASVYAYNPIGKRDPFEVFIAVDPLRGDNVQLQPLQQFSIDQLKLVGIIWGISNPQAMVEAPGGKGHVIKKGTLIGRNWGKVIRIKQDEVIIAEEFRDLDGKIIVNEISLKLPEPEPIEQ